jgi:hypothetical protein
VRTIRIGRGKLLCDAGLPLLGDVKVEKDVDDRDEPGPDGENR